MLLFYWGTVSPREDGRLGDSRSSSHVRRLILTDLSVFAPLIFLTSLDKYARRLDVVNRGRLFFLSPLQIASHLEGQGYQVIIQNGVLVSLNRLFLRPQSHISTQKCNFSLFGLVGIPISYNSNNSVCFLLHDSRSKRCSSRTLAAIRSYRQIQSKSGTLDRHGPWTYF